MSKNAELSEKFERLQIINSKQTQFQSHSETFIQNKKTQEENFQRIENNSHSNIHSLKHNINEENKSLRDEISHKNKLIQNLQQRINDMKKTLQKELKFQVLTSENSINDSILKLKSEKPILSNNPKDELQNTKVSICESKSLVLTTFKN